MDLPPHPFLDPMAHSRLHIVYRFYYKAYHVVLCVGYLYLCLYKCSELEGPILQGRIQVPGTSQFIRNC